MFHAGGGAAPLSIFETYDGSIPTSLANRRALIRRLLRTFRSSTRKRGFVVLASCKLASPGLVLNSIHQWNHIHYIREIGSSQEQELEEN
jgi:hypothetical protein